TSRRGQLSRRIRRRGGCGSGGVASRVEALRAGGRVIPAPPLLVPRVRAGRRLLVDGLARRVVTLGGAAVILSILAILVVIAAQAYPLFLPPPATPVSTPSPPAP